MIQNKIKNKGKIIIFIIEKIKVRKRFKMKWFNLKNLYLI